MTTRSRTILITGGSGFIGRNLIEDLSTSYEIRAPSHAELELTDAERVAQFLSTQRPDVILHSAAKPSHRNAKDSTGILEANLRMYYNLARSMPPCARMVFIGSGAVYDAVHCEPKMPETFFDRYVPADDHGFAKYIIAKDIECSSRAVELRVFGIFGPYEDYAIRFISNAICKALFGLPITLRQNRRFDYLWVADLASIVRHFIEHGWEHSAYNITPDAAVSLLWLAELVCEVAGAPDLEIRVDAPGEGLEYSGDNSRLYEAMPDLALTPIEDAVRELYAWYAARRDFFDRELLLADK